ncbi:MAG: cupin [Alphaproteobacteria bacterium]|nr:MAG: cupin [Alphaproteobacteria bacterium]PZO38351.1 MAG: cupin [Alphaproteobacteria bacterium]
MLSLDELLHPITPERFLADYHGRKPLHIPAGDGAPKRAILDWSRFNALLAQTSSWTASRLRMVRDNEPIPPEHYCTPVTDQSGTTLRPSPARVDVLLSTGASLIANDIDPLAPDMTQLAAMLSRAFGAGVSANAYCSFGGVQAFGTHFDLHDVFAIHCEGEKTWRLYENRADSPVAYPVAEDRLRPWFSQTRGALMQEIRMRPGDVLYLPRGWYHDALADAEPGNASLHLTYSVTPLYGRIIFGLLENAALQDPAFRAYFPPAGQDGGRALAEHLAGLGRKLADLAALPQFRDEVAATQERLVRRPATYDLPARKPLTLYVPTNLLPPAFSGPVTEAVGWAMSQPRFALEDMIAEFDFIAEADIRAVVQRLETAGALKRVI